MMSLLVVGSIAIGFGVTVAAFSFARAFDSRALPFRHSDIVSISETVRGNPANGVSVLDLADLAGSASAFNRTAAYTTFTGGVEASFVRDDSTRKVNPALVSANFFELLNVKPVLGGLFRDSDDPQIILSERVWRESFHGAASIIGKSVPVNTKGYFVVGVAPDEFDLPRGVDVWIKAPLLNPRYTQFRTNYLFHGFALLDRGVTLQNAQAQADVVAQRLGKEFPVSNRDTRFLVTPLIDGLESRLLAVASIFKILVIGIFVVVWVNFIMLLYARALDNRGELAIRIAIGAAWKNLFAGVAREFALWSIIGTVLGCGLAMLLLTTIRVLADRLLPRYVHAAIDWPVAIGWGVITLLSALVLAAYSTRRLWKVNPAEALQHGSPRIGLSRRTIQALRGLLAVEVAVTTTILICSVVFAHELLALRHWSFGLDPKNVLDVEFVLPPAMQAARAPLVVTAQEIVRQLKAVPGLGSAAIAAEDPFRNHYNFKLTMPGNGDGVYGSLKGVTPEYFETLGIPILNGRTFSKEDMGGFPGNCIVDRELAERLWPHSDPIGHTLKVSSLQFRVIGTVRAVNYYSQVKNDIYVPLQLFWNEGMVYGHIYARSGIQQSSSSLLEAVSRAAPQALIAPPTSLESSLGEYLLLPELGARLAGPMAILTALLSGLGVFVIVTYVSAARMNEIATRMALGAGKGHIALVFVRFLLLPAFGGIVCGAALAITSAPLWREALRNPVVFDWRILSVSLVLIAALIAIATFYPIKRATKIDSAILLRAL